MKTIMFTGVPGVGKSTLTSSIAEKLSWPYGSYVDIMLEVLGDKDRDTLRELPWKKRIAIHQQVDRIIKERFFDTKEEGGYFLFDNHITLVDQGGFVFSPIGAFWVYNLAGVCAIYASPDEILKKRKEDKNRKRESQPELFIQKHQLLNLEHSLMIAQSYSIPFIKLQNEYCEKTIEKGLEWVKSITKASGN